MKRKFTFLQLFMVAILASMISLSILVLYDEFMTGSKLFASNDFESGNDIALYASPRRDTQKDESFIFFNRETGDLWVYRNEKFKEHYRVGAMGQNLEKVKN